MTDAEIEELREAMRAQRSEIRDDLAEAGVDVSSWSGPGGDEESRERDTTDSG